jgi:hypothetical protein
MHGPNQFIQQLGSLAFEGQFDLTEYLRQFMAAYNAANTTSSFITNENPAYTTSVSETLLQYTLVPANTFENGTIAEVLMRFTNIDSLADAYVNVYVNTAPSLLGAQLLAKASMVSPIKYIQLVRTLHYIDSANGTIVFPVNEDSILEHRADYMPNYVGIDWTVDQYIITAGGVGNVLDLLESQLTFIKYYKQ